MEPFKIIEYQDRYHDSLIKISYAWLEKYFSVEPEDERVLNHPRENVLDGGGHIYFAKYDNSIVGTIMMVKTDENAFELAKLGVLEPYQGRRIGRMLIERCIQTAQQERAERLILYTNHVLSAAIHLYEGLGFKEIPQRVKKYIEADMKMELCIK